jgi:acetyltransferase-like isoleucine patch superfamily enzyme
VDGTAQARGEEEVGGNPGGGSALRRYQDFFVGRRGLWPLLRYEVAACLAGPMPGALGLLLRRRFYRKVCGRVGKGVVFGRNVALRHPWKMEIGDGSGFDDGCFLDARGAEAKGFRIGRNVMVAQNVGLQVKSGVLEVGDECVVGFGVYFGCVGGIKCGTGVLISGLCYLGGGRYRTDDPDHPLREQKADAPPLVIGDDCWIGAGAKILSGVTVGKGCVIGAGCVIQQDVPDYTVVSPFQKLVQLPRRRGSQ